MIKQKAIVFCLLLTFCFNFVITQSKNSVAIPYQPKFKIISTEPSNSEIINGSVVTISWNWANYTDIFDAGFVNFDIYFLTNDTTKSDQTTTTDTSPISFIFNHYHNITVYSKSDVSLSDIPLQIPINMIDSGFNSSNVPILIEYVLSYTFGYTDDIGHSHVLENEFAGMETFIWSGGASESTITTTGFLLIILISALAIVVIVIGFNMAQKKKKLDVLCNPYTQEGILNIEQNPACSSRANDLIKKGITPQQLRNNITQPKM